MAVWQRLVRVGLASFVLTFALALLYHMSARDQPPAARGVAPADPTAVVESRGARITLGDGSVITAERQFGYDDGSARLLEVEVIVPAGDDRTGFRLRGGEAAGREEAGEWRLAGAVAIETEDGLAGATSEASYVEATGIVTMPKAARFEQGWMRLEGDAAHYQRRRGLLELEGRTVVELRPQGDGGDPPTRIAAPEARIDRPAGVMQFTAGAAIDAGERTMRADRVVLRFDPEASRIDAIELAGDARVLGRETAGTGLREMSARTIAVTYRDGELERATLTGGARLQGAENGTSRLRELAAPTIDVAYRGGALERVTMTGGAEVELFGDRPGTAGLTIGAGSVRMAVTPESGDIDALRARESVTLAFPAVADTRRVIRSRSLDIASGAGERTAAFDGNVEMRESVTGRTTSPQDERVMRADRLEAVLTQGLARLGEARFLGGVTLAAGGLGARADRATYAPDEALFTLVTDAAGLTPRMDDERGFIQARTIAIDLEGPDIEATSDVKGVLRPMPEDSTSAVRPALFAAGEAMHFVAGRFAYDAAESLATYDRGARLWQGSTEFRGLRVVVDETTGNIDAAGSVQTRTTMLQQDEERGDAVENETVGRGEALSYDNDRRRITYTGRAGLTSPRSTLGGETIDLSLHADARTLDRIQVAGNVTLELDARSVTAATLEYDDREGRYDLTGAPVRVVERVAGGCRETTGRSVTFYSSGDSITADGQAAERTASASGACRPGPGQAPNRGVPAA